MAIYQTDRCVLQWVDNPTIRQETHHPALTLVLQPTSFPTALLFPSHPGHYLDPDVTSPRIPPAYAAGQGFPAALKRAGDVQSGLRGGGGW